MNSQIAVLHEINRNLINLNVSVQNVSDDIFRVSVLLAMLTFAVSLGIFIALKHKI